MHLLGFDHEISEEAEAEMQEEEELVLKSLGWKGKGLIMSAYDGITDGNPQLEVTDGKLLLALIFPLPFHFSLYECFFFTFILEPTLSIRLYKIAWQFASFYRKHYQRYEKSRQPSVL